MINLLLLALAPVCVIILYIYYKDKYNKEPKRLLLFSFLLGAIVSIIVTTIIYYLFDVALPLKDEFSVPQQFVKAFLVVGLTEEFSKYIFVRYFAQPKKEFDEPFYQTEKLMNTNNQLIIELGNRAVMYSTITQYYLILLKEGNKRSIELIKTLENNNPNTIKK